MEKLDITKLVSSDNIRDIEENLKGAIALLAGLQFADEAGQHIYQRESYITLQIALGKAVKDLEQIKGSVDYMMEQIN
ncbi:MAG: hypothetical protein C0625_01820 [Arcobacter sp.]|nr:MAG: hypothetical protein C0625_01820 [Arcobacter sp.]